MTRRRFLQSAAGLTAAATFGLAAAESATQPGRKFRAAIIGDTGHGNYGHEHDLIFNGRENVAVVAIADPDEAGRIKAAGRARALRQYGDYREMLHREHPELVCIAPRWTDQHHEMALRALRAGAHVYLEKPVTQTLAEADELLAVAKRLALKIVVAHQVRLAPNILALKAAIGGGLIGEMTGIRSHGKQDKRAGGEDLIVLGVHVFDLMRFFAGDATQCTANVLQGGQQISKSDAHPATENIGPVIGDDIEAQFTFSKSVHGSFTSRAKDREAAGPWGLELIGEKGAVKIQMDMIPKILLRRSGSENWSPWKDDPTSQYSTTDRGFTQANKRVVDDWLDAILQNREPICSGYAGMKALEMAMAVFAAGVSREKVSIPLTNRTHPLLKTGN